VELDLIPFFLLKNEASLKNISSYIRWKTDMYTVKGELLKESFIFQASILSAKAESFQGVTYFYNQKTRYHLGMKLGQKLPGESTLF